MDLDLKLLLLILFFFLAVGAILIRGNIYFYFLVLYSICNVSKIGLACVTECSITRFTGSFCNLRNRTIDYFKMF